MQVLAAAEFVRLASSPFAAELMGDVAVVDLRGDHTPDLRSIPVPRVTVGISPAARDDVDLVVADEEAAHHVVTRVRSHPIAATALVLHLRSVGALSIEDGLVAESATYSALQAGPEHERWLGERPAPRPHHDGDGDRVRVEREDHSVHIELTRASRRNAIDAAMQRALVDAFGAADDASQIVLTGAGPVFSAGGDLEEFGARADPATAHLIRLSRSPARAIARVAARTTAIVQGACHGAGVELPAFADQVIAHPDTTFTLPEVAMGLIPGAGGTVSITRRIGRQRTAWLAIVGDAIDSSTALAWGLVDKVDDRSGSLDDPDPSPAA